MTNRKFLQITKMPIFKFSACRSILEPDKAPFQYAIPKINMLCNLCCLETRIRLLCNKYQRHSSLNLVSQQLKLCNTSIFGMAYRTLNSLAPKMSDYRRIHQVKFSAFHGNQLEYNGSQGANVAGQPDIHFD